MQNLIVSEAAAAYGKKPRHQSDREPWLRKKFWTEAEYLALETNRLIEFKNGELEILPMPDYIHQTIADIFKDALKAHPSFKDGGKVVGAPFRLRLPNGNYREPDVLYLTRDHRMHFAIAAWTGADIVLEVVSPGDEKRDLVDKRSDYASAQVPEYWIVEPAKELITVLKLVGDKYIEHGTFKKGDSATSALLTGFSVDVTALLTAD